MRHSAKNYVPFAFSPNNGKWDVNNTRIAMPVDENEFFKNALM